MELERSDALAYTYSCTYTLIYTVYMDTLKYESMVKRKNGVTLTNHVLNNKTVTSKYKHLIIKAT